MHKPPRILVGERALPFSRDNYQEIEVKMGNYDGSKKCHHRSRQLLEEGVAENVTVTLSFVPTGGVNVHFINKINGEYVDHTLGYLSKANTYFLVSEHTLEDLANMRMDKMLMSIKADMINNLYSKEEQKELGITDKEFYL